MFKKQSFLVLTYGGVHLIKKEKVMEFNQNQVNGIEHFKGPCQVLAGPGSGKTLTIVNRIHNLIYNRRINPEEILVITFTKSAALEMEQRFLKLVGSKNSPVTFGTFHGIFYGILRNTYRFNHSNIFSEREKYKLLEEIVRNRGIETFDDEDFIKDLIADISRIKNNKLDLEDFIPKTISGALFRKIFNDYEELRRNAKKIDFDDMLVLCYDLLVSRQQVLKEWQIRFKYILVDEFQDINKIQYDVLMLLAKPEDNLFVVGDDDQSIYGFRGASYKLLFQFQEDFPQCKQIVLNENYRSTKNIITKATKLIKQNRYRYPKEIITRNQKGQTVHIQETRNPSDESEHIIEKIRKRLELGIELSDICILYRTHRETKSLVEKLVLYNIPFQTNDKIHNIYDNFIAKDIKAYFKIALGIGARQDFLQVMNRPLRYLGRESLPADSSFNSSAVNFEEMKNFYCDKEWMLDKIDIFQWDLKMLETMSPYAGIQYIKKKIGYDDFLVDYGEKHRLKIEGLMEQLAEIEESSRNHLSIKKWLDYITKHEEAIKEKEKNKGKYLGHEKDNTRQGNLNSVIDNKGDFQGKQSMERGVQLMTMHGAKGLEFNTVFVIGVNEGTIPYIRNMEKNLEEERRLFYVAITRAKECLTITYTKEKSGSDRSPSRFIEELLS